MKTRRLFTLSALICGLVLIPMERASAHTTADGYFPNHWSLDAGSPSGTGVQFFFTTSFPSSAAWRNRARAGFATWNALDPAFVWVELPPTGDFNPASCTNAVLERNGVHLRHFPSMGAPYDATDLAATFNCYYPQEQKISSNIVFNSAKNWSTEETNIPNLFDVQAIATHEVGHAGGYNKSGAHWDPAANICVYSNQLHTMCPIALPNDLLWRTLEDHDVHTFQWNY